MQPNPITVVCLSTALFSRWTMIGHHTCHGGYDNTKAAERGFHRKIFAVGSLARRALDWFDWMLPEAWNIEHGRLHHYSLNEDNDPDLVEKNATWMRSAPVPKLFKYVVVLFFAFTWKWTYYSSNTYSQLLFTNKMREMNSISEQMKELKDDSPKEKLLAEKKDRHVVTIFKIFDRELPSWWSTTGFLRDVVLPFLIYRFIITPLPFYFIFGPSGFNNAMVNLLLADLLTNVHSFIAVVPNHAGEDLYYFEDHCEPKSDEFFLRQVIGSVDFSAGSNPVDFFHGFLNYQIEHHLWPDLSMLSYQRAHPLVKDICKKYNVPFVQHNVFYRVYKTVQIFVGENSMRQFDASLLKART